MENICKIIKTNTPTLILVPIIQTILSLPHAISRFLIETFTSPTQAQKSWIKKIARDNWKGAWIGPSMSECIDDGDLLSRIQGADLIIYKAHGGGFRIGNAVMYMDVFQTWINLLKEHHNITALILSVDYSLAPEHQYPVPVLECVGAYKYLINTLKIPGSKIILSGDSAGGSLCIETLIRVYAPNMLFDHLNAPRTNFEAELPAGLVLVSPLVSANIHEWLWHYKEDLVTKLLTSRVLTEYLNLPEADIADLHLLKLAHISSDYNRFAPRNLLCYVGEREVMRDEILKLVQTVRRDGKTNVEVRQENYEHDWYFIREVVKFQDRHILYQSDRQFADFAAKCLKEATVEDYDGISEVVQVDDLAKSAVDLYTVPPPVSNVPVHAT